MNKRNFAAAAILTVSSILATSACAGKPAMIEAPVSVVQSVSPQSSELSAQWIDGRRQEMAGVEQIDAGEKMIRKARKDERKTVEKHAKLVLAADEQRAAYVRLVAGFGGAASPAAVDTEIKALKKTADDWKDAAERVTKAESRVKTAQAEIANGESGVRTGNEQVLAGREKMRRAEMQSQPQYRDEAQSIVENADLADMN